MTIGGLPRYGNVLLSGTRKIQKDCSIKRHKLVAMAFSRSGHLICTETNRKGSGAVSDFSIHAEEFLVRKLRKISARERYGKIRVVVARLARSGWALARPCEGCRKLLRDYGITEVWYTQCLVPGTSVLQKL